MRLLGLLTGFFSLEEINFRFAHVARKHHLEEVCVNALAKIYTLPNIEIQDAFLKLREQAKCYISDYNFDGGNPHTTGLEVINNTNLHFFQQPQKAEFFALKGVFLGKLGMIEEANQAFSSSLQIDVNLGKAWSSWGRFNDERYESGLKTADFNSSSDNADYHQCAADVVRSYLQAASLNKSQKSRKYIARILNLVGTYGLQVASDSQPLTSNKHAEKVLNTFVQYKGEMHVWYWIPFIPQLLGIIKCQNGEKISFTDNLVTMAKVILLRIAKLYPQSLYFALRRAREEALALNSSQNMEIEENQGSQKKSSDSLDGIVAGGFNGGGNDEELDFTASTTNNQKKDDAMDVDQNILGGNADDAMSTSFSTAANQSPVQHLDNVIGVIKTGFPLLALTLEHLIDQMVNRLLIPFECQLSEVVDAAILELESTGKDFLSEEIISALQKLNTDKKTPAYNEIIESVGILADGNVDQVLESLKAHRKKLLAKIDEISTKQNLNRVSSYLVDFEYQRFDDNLEIPGQYLKHLNKDSNSDFVRIERIKPEYSIIRKYSEKEKRHVFCFKLTFIASDASTHDFIIDNGSPNQTEFSVFASLLNIRLEKQVNSRRRNAVLHTENAVQVGHGKCLSEYDPSIKLLQDLYIEKFDEEDQMWRTEVDSLRFNTALTSQQRADKAIKVIEKAINNCQFYLSEYLLGTCSTLSDFYVFRQRFATSLAGSNFISFILQLGDRACFKFGFTNTGNVAMRDIDPEYSAEKKDYVYSDALEGKNFAVPFRLSASMQTFLNAFSIEGTYSGNIVAISSSLLENKVPLNYFVSLFVFYDLIGKYHTSGSEHSYDDFVKTFYNVRDSLIGRVEHLSCRKNKVQNEDNVSPIDQPIMDLIKEATNPNNYAEMLLADRSNAKACRVSVGYDYIPWF
jgi:transformation/transcription domain-associated protein